MSIFKRKKQQSKNKNTEAPLSESAETANFDGNHPEVPLIDYTQRHQATEAQSDSDDHLVITALPVTKNTDSAAEQPQARQKSVDWSLTEQQLNQLDEQRDQLADSLRDELLTARSIAKYDLRQLNRPNQGADTPLVDDHQVHALEQKIATLNQKLTHWYGTDKMANEIHFDPQRPYLLLNNGLVHQPTETQRHSLQRLVQLFQREQIVPTQVTIDYDDLLQPTWQHYQEHHLATPETTLRNLFQDLQDWQMKTDKKANELFFAPGFKVVQAGEQEKVYDPQEKLNMIIRHRQNGNLFTVQHFLNEALLSQDLFDNDGVLSATQYYAATDAKKVVRENFYRPDGTLAMVKSYLPDEPYIQVLGPTNVLMAVFDSDLALINWWFEHQVLQTNSVIIVSIDSVLYQTLLAAQDQGLEVIPLVSELDPQSPQLQDLANHRHGIESILVAEPSIKHYLEQQAQIDLDITVISPLATVAHTVEK
ncbi:hypothetical protein [Lapidilactobacillus gannanensis]|uniref:Uncharacterized protein n=1 Tax=Lapidilactobacillus gannanensis TaxID=2486002 RepID=A0ABW4BJZ7_9LACO|nr:hypothetical protein [Lapidilactobacillus gannanensis]